MDVNQDRDLFSEACDKKRMKLNYHFQDHGDFLCVDKASGVATHRSDDSRWGWVEYIQQSYGHKLYPVHRLDVGTSGCLLLPTSSESAQIWTQRFQNHEVQKTYLFVTDRTHPRNQIQHASLISGAKKIWHSDPKSGQPNAWTDFQKIESFEKYTLWQAQPRSGKTHQIRLHAADLGIPLLGDSLYNGTNFHGKIFLHSQSLNYKDLHLKAHDVWWTQSLKNLKLAKDAQDFLWSLDFRQCLFSESSLKQDQCLRMAHLDSQDFRWDQLGQVWWINWYSDQAISDDFFKIFQETSKSWKKTPYIRRMQNRGQDPLSKESIGEIPSIWNAFENEFQFEFRRDQGLSAGLFLDQRDNRQWVFQNSKNKKVLNLFSYTGGFSVAAAKGESAEVCTVDLSGNFLEWSKQNFVHNLLDPQKYEFRKMNSFDFLDFCQKKNRTFDLIICDPPSFSRDGKKVFRLEKDFATLLDKLQKVLSQEGTLIFSCNYEDWSQEFFEKLIFKSLPGFEMIKDNPKIPLDFEKPGELALLKIAFLRRKN
jgi:23S rRNA (cytosine1962-C5)-methyltransferase